MEFKQICMFFNKVKQTKGPSDKAKLIQEFFSECRKSLGKAKMFSVMRVILPKLDRDRQYNMKESKVARVLIKMLALPDGNEKTVLSKSYLMAGQASDFSDVVYSVIRKYLANYTTTLTLDELNSQLDAIVNKRSESEAEDIIMGLFKKCSPEDDRWIIRLILKDLKLGIDSNKILNCYHKHGAYYYSSNSNLAKLTELLYDETVNVYDMEIKIFEAFKPMLSKRVDINSFKKDFEENKVYYVENKFDGERFQLHMENDVFKYLSRNGFDYTSTYGSGYDSGILTPKLKGVFEPVVKKIILDGEMMLWDKKLEKYGSKGMELDVKKLKDHGQYQPCYCVYDVLMFKDIILINKPLKERRNYLKRVFKHYIRGTLVLSETDEVTSREEILTRLNTSCDNEEEGIIVKDPNSLYRYNDRKSGWFKMKMEYFEDTVNDLDLVLMGGQFASSTSDILNSYIVGIRSGNTVEGKPKFVAFARVSSGVNAEQLRLLNHKLKEQGKAFDNNHSTSLVFGKTVPDYYLEPEFSLVFTVRATELIKIHDTSYKTPYTLRFPRIVALRHDKPVDDCLSLEELNQLTNNNKKVIKLNNRYLDVEKILQTKTRQVKRQKIVVTAFADDRKISDLLEGYTFNVLSGTKDKCKDDWEALVKKAGGSISYKLDDGLVDIVLVGDYNSKAKELMASKRHKFDVISSQWLTRVLQDGNLLGYQTEEIFCLGTSIKNCLSDEVDRYGDSYTEEATVKSLQHCFAIMENLGETPSYGHLLQVRPKKCFANYQAYFDKFLVIGDAESEIIGDISLEDELEFRYWNGNVCKEITLETNVIVYNGDSRRKGVLKNYVQSINRSDIEIKDKSFIYE